MGIEELRIIAEIMGGLESTGITGFLAFLGVQVLEVLLWVGLLLVVIYCVYKLINKAIEAAREPQRLRHVAQILGAEYYGDATRAEWEAVVDQSTKLFEYKGKYEEQAHSLKDYMGRLGSLSKDYETLWETHEKQKEQLENCQKHCITLEQELTAKAQDVHLTEEELNEPEISG